MLLLIDNHDSFTYNLVQYLQELDQDVLVVTNDQYSLAQLRALAPSGVLISPGPCTPDQAGVSMAAIDHFANKVPILGVCLGHQCIGQVFGGRIVEAAEILHGRTSQIEHQQQGVFAGLPSPMRVTRYHSLVIEPASLPSCLQVTAWVAGQTPGSGDIMAVAHRHLAIQGVQFHPESILSEHGHALLRNFVAQF